MFSYLSPEQRVRPDHPLRAIRRMTDEVLRELSPRFDRMYSDMGRPSIPPEQLLRALLLQALYTIRSERLLMEEIDYSILFRWFIGLEHGRADLVADDLQQEPRPAAAGRRRQRVLRRGGRTRRARPGLMSDEHFTVDGTLLEAWASLKSFQRKDDGPHAAAGRSGQSDGQFPRGNAANDTHQSTTDPDAQLYREGPRARKRSWRISGHVLLDNRHGLVANVCVDGRDRHGRTGGGPAAARRKPPTPTTVGGDKDFDVASFVAGVRALGITPHVAQKAKGSAIDGRTTRHAGLRRSVNASGN